MFTFSTRSRNHWLLAKREIIETQIEHTRLSFLDRQSSEQNNRKLISLHNNGEDGKHAHGFADF